MLAKTSLLASLLCSPRHFAAVLALVLAAAGCGGVDPHGLTATDGGPTAKGGQAGGVSRAGAGGAVGTGGAPATAGQCAASGATCAADGDCCSGRCEPVTGLAGVRQCTNL